MPSNWMPELVTVRSARCQGARFSVTPSGVIETSFTPKGVTLNSPKPRKALIHLDGCDVTVFNYYHPLENYFEALTTSGFEVRKFVEPVLRKKYKGWPEDNYRIPRSIVIEAQMRCWRPPG